MKKKIIIALGIPVIGVGTYLGLSVLMPVAEPTTGVVMRYDDYYEKMSRYLQDPTISEVVVTSDNHYLSMSVENINVTVNATKNQ